LRKALKCILVKNWNEYSQWKRLYKSLIYYSKKICQLNRNKFSNLDKIKAMKIKVYIIVKKSTIKAEYSPYKQKVEFYLYFLRLYNKLS